MKLCSGIVVVRLKQAGIQFDRLLKLLLCAVKLLGHEASQSARRVRLSKVRVQFERTFTGCIRLLTIASLRIHIHDQKGVAVGVTSPRQREFRVNVDGFAKH